MTENIKPRIALVLGDPCGIGPELGVKVLGDSTITDRADIVVVADRKVFDKGADIAGISVITG